METALAMFAVGALAGYLLATHIGSVRAAASSVAAAGQADVVAAVSKLESSVLTALHIQTAAASAPRPVTLPAGFPSGPFPTGGIVPRPAPPVQSAPQAS